MARLLDGIDDGLTVASAVATAAPMTMACWFIANNITAEHVLMDIDDGSDANKFQIRASGAVASDPIRALTVAASTSSIAVSSTGYSANVWQHACGVFASATDRRAFVNGGSKGTNATSRTPSGLTTLRIGRELTAFAAGRIAEAAIWDIALTDAQVASLAKGASPLTIQPGNLVFYAPLLGNDSPEPDRVGGLSLTVAGATKTDHPPTSSFRSPRFAFGLPASGSNVTITVPATPGVTVAASAPTITATIPSAAPAVTTSGVAPTVSATIPGTAGSTTASGAAATVTASITAPAPDTTAAGPAPSLTVTTTATAADTATSAPAPFVVATITAMTAGITAAAVAPAVSVIPPLAPNFTSILGRARPGNLELAHVTILEPEPQPRPRWELTHTTGRWTRNPGTRWPLVPTGARWPNDD